jgi:hypothetical protein
VSEGLTYTEAKKIVNDWRKDFACNVSEGYIISAFLDDAFIIKKLRTDLAAATARAEAAERERDALRTECEEWRENYAALEAVAIASERERQAAEAALAAVPVEAIRRYFDQSDALAAVEAGEYDMHEGMSDCQGITEWLEAQEVQP